MSRSDTTNGWLLIFAGLVVVAIITGIVEAVK